MNYAALSLSTILFLSPATPQLNKNTLDDDAHIRDLLSQTAELVYKCLDDYTNECPQKIIYRARSGEENINWKLSPITPICVAKQDLKGNIYMSFKGTKLAIRRDTFGKLSVYSFDINDADLPPDSAQNFYNTFLQRCVSGGASI